MNCLIMIAGVCALDTGNIYLTAGLSAHENHETQGSLCSDGRNSWRCKGPYAEVKLGMVIEISRQVSLDVGYMHRSFLVDRDYGTNGPYAALTWRPWR